MFDGVSLEEPWVNSLLHVVRYEFDCSWLS